MEPGIRGEAPFNGKPTPNLCPGCGDRLFSVKPGHLKCELCGAEVMIATPPETEEGWGGDDVAVRARPAIPAAIFRRQRRQTGAVMV